MTNAQRKRYDCRYSSINHELHTLQRDVATINHFRTLLHMETLRLELVYVIDGVAVRIVPMGEEEGTHKAWVWTWSLDEEGELRLRDDICRNQYMRDEIVGDYNHSYWKEFVTHELRALPEQLHELQRGITSLLGE